MSFLFEILLKLLLLHFKCSYHMAEYVLALRQILGILQKFCLDCFLRWNFHMRGGHFIIRRTFAHLEVENSALVLSKPLHLVYLFEGLVDMHSFLPDHGVVYNPRNLLGVVFEMLHLLIAALFETHLRAVEDRDLALLHVLVQLIRTSS